MMDLDDMLAEALARIESMSAEEFEKDCIEFGYEPVRKSSILMSEAVTVVTDTVKLQMTYRHSNSIMWKGQTHEEFGSSISDTYNFPLAA